MLLKKNNILFCSQRASNSGYLKIISLKNFVLICYFQGFLEHEYQFQFLSHGYHLIVLQHIACDLRF